MYLSKQKNFTSVAKIMLQADLTKLNSFNVLRSYHLSFRIFKSDSTISLSNLCHWTEHKYISKSCNSYIFLKRPDSTYSNNDNEKSKNFDVEMEYQTLEIKYYTTFGQYIVSTHITFSPFH